MTSNEMLSLTDMWRAAGSDLSKRPVEWLRSKAARAFIEVLAEMMGGSSNGKQFSDLERLAKVGVFRLPSVKGRRVDFKEVRNLKIGGAQRT